MFLGPLFLKTDEAGRFLFFISQKTDEANFFFNFTSSEANEAPFLVHFKHKNVDILILTYKLIK